MCLCLLGCGVGLCVPCVNVGVLNCARGRPASPPVRGEGGGRGEGVEGRPRVVVVPGLPWCSVLLCLVRLGYLLSVGVCVSTGKVRLDPTVRFVRSACFALR